MRLVLSISEKAARRLRILAAEQGHRGVSALIESVYGGDTLLLANLVAKLAAQGPGTMTGNDIDWTKFDADRGVPPFVTRTRELTDAQIGDLIKQGPAPIVAATDCGFGPGPFLIDSERAKELEQVMEARGLEELKCSRDKALMQEDGRLGVPDPVSDPYALDEPVPRDEQE